MDRRPTIPPWDLDCTKSPNKIARTEEFLVASGTMRRSSITASNLECMLCDEMAEPQALPLSLLEEITNGFSDEHRIGSGGFAVVYKGKLENRTVAVKRMAVPYEYEKEFRREVECLMMVKHNNIVRFLGYCADTQGSMEKYEGKFVMAEVQQKLLCFEYLPKGSLHEYITETSLRLRWTERYKIITGICHGLHYLHQKNIIHLDLKPANILLDDNWVPKITDFGISRCFDKMQSQVITKIAGTIGYLAPESFNNIKVTYRESYRLDIYSLGVVIIEILTGERGYHDVDNVVESWSKIVEKSQSDVQLKQVRVCAEIGVECIDSNPAKRPDMENIINRLNKYIETSGITSQQENATAATVAGTNTCNSFWENTANLEKLNETMHTLNPDIRRCFELCSIFPRGSKLKRDELVRLWIAQEFVKTSCATDDLEDIAGGYIQELVSCSFLKPIGTDCFIIIHDVLDDILDKVAGNCFRIENARSHRGEGWEGDVPPDIQHLFLENYNGDLITEKLLGLENLRTLIVYVVGKDTPVEEKVIDSICKRLPKLRVLAVAFSQEHDPIEQPKFSFPESVGQLKHLRYLCFRAKYPCNITLPSTLNKVQHIQVLDFADGRISEFTFAELVNLQYLFCYSFVKIPYVGRLSSLQTLPVFTVSNEQGRELKQLRDLNKLRGNLSIDGLANVKSKGQALEANLAAKRLTQLTLDWGDGVRTRCSPVVEADVLEGLCPPVGLKILSLWNYEGWRYPGWMMGNHNGGPKYLQELYIIQCRVAVPFFGLAEAFPHLRMLRLSFCSWDVLPDNMVHLTSLKDLWILYCENIRSLPSLPQSLEKFTLEACNDQFMESCKTAGHPNWEKIEHIPEKHFIDQDAILYRLTFQGRQQMKSIQLPAESEG